MRRFLKRYMKKLNKNYKNIDAIRYFDEISKVGRYYSSARPIYVKPSKIFQDIQKKLRIKKNELVLDAGCGSGLLSVEAAKKCKNVYAIDMATKPLLMASHYIVKKKLNNIFFLKNDICDLSFRDNLFDKIIVYAVLHYMENLSQLKIAINELLRVCKKNGKILVAEITDENLYENLKLKENQKILNKFNYEKKKYDQKINKIKFKIPKKNFKISPYLVSAEFKKKGCKVSILTQNKELPFSITRKDILVTK